MHKSLKPVRKCHACPLNLGDSCAVFPDPHKQWQHGKCPGFKNEELHQQYLAESAKHPPDSAKEKRRERAKLARTQHPPSFFDGFRARGHKR